MSALILYLAVAAGLFILWNRYVQQVTVAAALVIVLLPFCFTGRALLTGKIYAPIDLPYMSEPLKEYAAEHGIAKIHNATLSDLYCQIIPWRKAVRYAYSIGEWPLWNPFMLCGDILAQAAQPAPYDPFTLLSLLIPLAPSLTFSAAITFFLAAFSTFVFARLVGLREWPSVLAAAIYMYCGVLAFFVGWPIARAWAVMPFVLVGVRLVVHERSLRAAAVLVAALTVEVFAGHPESLFHVTVIGCLYGLFELVSVRRDPRRAITLAFAAGVVALCLTAIFLVPFIEATTQTYETVVRTEIFARTPLDTSPEQVGKRAGLAFLPWFGQRNGGSDITHYWAPEMARVGGLAVALALASLVLAPRRMTWFFVALAAFCLLAAFDAPPLANWLHSLPLFDIALNDRLAFGACFALAMLAAIAADSWPAGRVRFAAAGVMLLCTAGLALATWLTYKPHSDLGMSPADIKLLAAIDMVPIVLAAALLLLRVNARVAVPLLIAFVLIQRTAQDGDFYPTIAQKAFYPSVPVIEAIPKGSSEPFRMIGRDYAFVPDSAALYELEDARGYEAMTFLRLAETFPLWSIPQPVWFNRVPDLDKPFLSMINVRYALSPGAIAIPDGWRHVMQDRGTSLLENTRVLPRAFVPKSIRYEQHADPVLRGMREATDFREVGWIQAPELGPHDAPNGPGEVVIRRDGLAYDIDATMQADGWVIVTNSAWKGWRATIDGRRVETRYANHAFVGVHVPRGQHRVRLVYLPESFVIGRAISFVTVAVLMIVTSIVWWRRRRARRDTAPSPA